jgi:HK97 family phage portal protein
MLSLPDLNNAPPDAMMVKAASEASYVDASVRVIDGYGSKGAKPRPFNQTAAVRQFGGWVYKAGMLNANAVGRIPLRLYVKRRSSGFKLYDTRPVRQKRLRYLKGETAARPSRVASMKVAEWDGEFEEVTEPHPVLKLLARPNPWSTGFDLTQMRILFLQLAGNAYTHKVTDRVLRVPSQLWTMPAQHVSIKPSKTNFIDGYVYGTSKENEQTFLPDEVIHNKSGNPRDLFYGMGCVEAVWTALGLHSSKRTMDQAKFDNMNRPDWFIAFKAGYNPDALKRFESMIDEKFKGPSKSGKFLAIGGDATIQALNQQLDEIGDSDRIVEEIAAGFGVPVSMLKASDPNRASAQTADTAWLRDTIRPLALADEESLNAQLLADFDIGEDAFLAYDPVSFEDETTLRRNAAAGVSGALLTVNEGREEIGYGPTPGGDVRYPPSGATGPNASLQGPMQHDQNQERQNENADQPPN